MAGLERLFESQSRKVIVMDYVHNLCAEFDKLEVMLACSIQLQRYVNGNLYKPSARIRLPFFGFYSGLPAFSRALRNERFLFCFVLDSYMGNR